ncbi:hypothetical protein AMTRI_Chr02g223900 [Amborella trichopoda]
MLPAIPSPLASSPDSSPGASILVDTMGDPLSPPSVDSEYVNDIDKGQGQILEVIKIMGFPQTIPDEHFQEFFKDELQNRFRVRKKGSRELHKLACNINYDQPSSSNSTSPIPLKHRPHGKAHL